MALIPGASNVSADDLSRNFKADTEWALRNDVFVRLCSLFGVPDIDLFASRLNHKVPKYASWKPDPLASFVDASRIKHTLHVAFNKWMTGDRKFATG